MNSIEIINILKDINKEHNNMVIMLIGLPASGKTTLTHNIINNFTDYNIISRDDIIEELIKDKGISYSESFNNNYSDIQTKASDILQENLKNHSNKVIIDMTNLTSNSRIYKLSYFDNTFYKIAIKIPLPINTIINRNKKRKFIGKEIPYNVIYSMKQTYESVSIKEGFNLVLRLDEK